MVDRRKIHNSRPVNLGVMQAGSQVAKQLHCNSQRKKHQPSRQNLSKHRFLRVIERKPSSIRRNQHLKERKGREIGQSNLSKREKETF